MTLGGYVYHVLNREDVTPCVLQAKTKGEISILSPDFPPGELPASPGPSSYGEALVVDDATGEARQDWRQSDAALEVRDVPVGRGGRAEDTFS